MPWQDRIREAAYTSPGGTRVVFTYSNVARTTTKRTTAFEFPGVAGAYVQDNGRGARVFPLRCIFAGADHDLAAEAFEAALLERGVGRLEHPFYGTHDVVPFGDITRRDDLRDAANQTVVEVTFWRSLRAVYPRGQAGQAGDVRAALDDYRGAQGEQFESGSDLSTTVARASAATRWRANLDLVSANLATVAAVNDDIRRGFDDAMRAIDLSLDVLLGQPLELVAQTVDLLALPAEADARLEVRLGAYLALSRSIIAEATSNPAEALIGGSVLPGRRRTVTNDFLSAQVYGLGAVGGAVLATVETDYLSRPHAIAAAAALAVHLGEVVEWMDTGFEALEVADATTVDTGEAYQAIQAATAAAAGYLLDTAFALVPERRVVLDRPRTVIDLAAELYGAVDTRIEFLIETNELTGSEILELPRGKSIVYYA